MNKTLIAAIAVVVSLALSTGLALSSHTSEITLSAIGPDPDAMGEARITVESMGNLDNVKIKTKVKNLETPEGSVMEGWLVDMDTGYKLSLGGFETNQDGKDNFEFRQNQVNFDLYDKLVITLEPAGDMDPNPAVGVLAGDL